MTFFRAEHNTGMAVASRSLRAGAGRSVDAAADSAPALSFTVPAPPSTNNLFINTHKGRVKSRLYKDWLERVGRVRAIASADTVQCRVLAVVGVERHNDAADLDNRLKALFDALVHWRVLHDDSLITAHCNVWLPRANGMAHVHLIPVDQASMLTFRFHASPNGACGSWVFDAPFTTGEDDGDQAV